MIDDKIEQLITQKYLKTCDEVEKILANIGLTQEDLLNRSYKTIEGGLTTYYFDDRPIVQSEISFHGNIITFSVKRF